jgi:acyl-CoA thioesterase-1
MREGLRIVTLGSSSTEGIGASAPAMAYPAQLQRILDIRFPDARFKVINRGIAQEVVAGNLVRLDRDVLSLSPDLVIWKVGTNGAM